MLLLSSEYVIKECVLTLRESHARRVYSMHCTLEDGAGGYCRAIAIAATCRLGTRSPIVSVSFGGQRCGLDLGKDSCTFPFESLRGGDCGDGV